METKIEIHGLKEILTRFQRLPAEVSKVLRINMQASLNVLHENVPPYPPPPTDSTYRRTGTLGRTLGSSDTGGASGKPEIFEIKQMGHEVTGRFGTKLNYAPYVIGESEQAEVHKGRWWTVKAVAENAKAKIGQIWQAVGEALARYLEKGR